MTYGDSVYGEFVYGESEPPFVPTGTPEWGVALEGIYLSGGDGSLWQDVVNNPACSGHEVDPQIKGCLSAPPDGLGVPPLRTEDVTYVQRDGARHFSDWYEPRIITLENVTVSPDDCPGCPSARVKASHISRVWKRHCDDTELVIFTDCHNPDVTPLEQHLVGPFGIIGRPRAAPITWLGQGSKSGVMTLRFDAIDHLMYILDVCGTPGSGGVCITLSPSTLTSTRCYDEGTDQRCYEGVNSTGRCYPNETGTGTSEVGTFNHGTECVPLTITLTGPLTNPFIENDLGERIDYNGVITAGSSVVIDTSDGTADEDGASRTHLISGSVTMQIPSSLPDYGPEGGGGGVFRMGSFSPSDTGEAEICFRPAVVSA